MMQIETARILLSAISQGMAAVTGLYLVGVFRWSQDLLEYKKEHNIPLFNEPKLNSKHCIILILSATSIIIGWFLLGFCDSSTITTRVIGGNFLLYIWSYIILCTIIIGIIVYNLIDEAFS